MPGVATASAQDPRRKGGHMRRRQRVSALLGAGMLLAAAIGVQVPASAAPAAPCGTMSLSSTSYTHVICVWMENHSYGDIIGNTTQAPYINNLASECAMATNYHNISHPSLPNYIGATSGLSLKQLKTFDSDCSVSKHCSTAAPSIFAQGETS